MGMRLLAWLLPLLAACSSPGSTPADAGVPQDSSVVVEGGAADTGAGGDDASLASDAADSSAAVDAAESGTSGCPVTSTSSGPVQGALTVPSQTTCAYEGIPYAAPPVGALRWKAPVAPTPWSTPRPSAFGSACPQLASWGEASVDEDCLYLNVWAPVPRAASAAPVMVFVHGGGFIGEAGDLGVWDGANLATTTGNIVLTINYRLGPFGFLSNPALRAEDPHGSAGDYGILDQIAAFQWVHDNIAAFGGDPTKVTIFGESAGATSMFVHLASPVSKGLFSRVIVESGFALPAWNGAAAKSQALADSMGASFAAALGCTDPGTLLSCLRAAAVQDALGALAIPGSPSSLSVWPWFPVIDGYVLPTDPIQAIASGTFNEVPTLLGNNRNEGTLTFYGNAPTDDASYLADAEALAPGHGAAVVAEYPIASYSGSYFDAASAMVTDGRFLCPTRRVARGIAASGTPTFRYDFTHVITDCTDHGLGAFHSAELLFVFGNGLPCGGTATLLPSEVPLSQAIMGYWGTMASTGNPNGGGLFMWPQYDTTTETEIVLDLTQSTEMQYEKAQCDFWDSLVVSGVADGGADAAGE
jgi:para-nitrobenzyl esterase